MTLYQIASYFRPGKPEPPERNEAYKNFIRRFPCVVPGCGQRFGIEAAHFGPHGTSQKSSDLSCLPLCRVHHRTGPKAYHKFARNFAAYHGIDVEAHQGYFQDVWEMKQRKKAV